MSAGDDTDSAGARAEFVSVAKSYSQRKGLTYRRGVKRA